MSQSSKIMNSIEKANEFIGKITSWLVLVLIITVSYEVIARYLFDSPTIWSYEMSYFISSFFVIKGMAYTMQAKGHVAVDVIYNKFSPRTQNILYVMFALLFFFPMWGMIIRHMIPHVIAVYQSGEKSWVGSWLPPIWPFKTWILVGTFMLLLQGIIEFIKNLKGAIRGVDVQ